MLSLDCGVCIIYSKLGKAPFANDRLMNLARVIQGSKECLEKMDLLTGQNFRFFTGSVKNGTRANIRP